MADRKVELEQDTNRVVISRKAQAQSSMSTCAPQPRYSPFV